MKATERCSCGGEFTAEGRGAKVALLEWRQTHQHTTAPSYDWWRYPDTTQPSYPYYPTITSDRTAEVKWVVENSPFVTYTNGYSQVLEASA